MDIIKLKIFIIILNIFSFHIQNRVVRKITYCSVDNSIELNISSEVLLYELQKNKIIKVSISWTIIVLLRT
jgi:hypothetical protein